jgi:hypothetical protein
VPTIRINDRAFAIVRHPAGHGFVSLSAKASNDAGAAVEQTILRAYRY